MKNSKLFLTSLLAAATMSVPAFADIYINFNSEEASRRTGDTTAGVVKDGDGEWNNVTNSFANDLALKDILNQSTSATLTYTSANVWAWPTGREGSILNGYLDDGGSGVSISVSDVPYLVYSVNIYGVSDATGNKLSYKTVNGVNYTKDASENVVIGTDAWGEAQQAEINANNTLTVSGLTGDLSISSIRPNNGPRACIAGIQIINTYTGTATSATLDADATWTASNLGSAAWTNSTTDAGTYADITLTADAVLTADAGIVTDGIIVGGAHTLTLANGASGSLTLSGPATLRASAGATLAFETTQISRAEGVSSVTLAGTGTIAFTDADGAAAYRKIGTDFTASSNTTVKILGNANFGTDALSVSSGIREFAGGLTAGSVTATGGTTNFSGTGAFTVTGIIETKNGAVVNQTNGVANAQRLVLHNSAANGADTYNLSGGVLNITSTSTVADNTAAVLVGHWASGSGALNLSGTGVLNVAEGGVSASHTSSGSISISGDSELNAYVLHLKSQGSSSAVTVSGNGRLNLGEGGFDNTSATNVLTFDGGTLGTFADAFSSSGAVSLGANGIIVDTEKRTLSTTGASSAWGAAASITLNGVLSDAADATGSLTKRGTGTLTLGGENTYSGATVVEAGTLVAGNATAFGSAATAALTVKTGAAVGVGTGVSLKDLTLESGTRLLLGNLAAGGTAFTVSGTASVAENLTIDVFGLASGTYTVVSGGGSINWSWLDASDFVLSGTHQTISNINTTTSSFTISSSNIDLVWNGTDGDKWSNGGEKVWTVAGSATESDFMNGDNVTFDKNASVAVDAGGVTAGKVTIASDKTVTLTGGNVTAQSGFELQTGATLSLGAGSANGATATLDDNSVYAITASTTGEVALGNVSGTGTLKFAGVGNLTDGGGSDPAFSTVAIGSGFTGTVEITAGLVDMLTDGETSAILPSRLGRASKVVLNGGGLLFRNVDNTTLDDKGTNDKGTFDKTIEVGANGGVIRVYGNGNVTVASDISGAGTLKHTDGGTLTLTGTVNMTGGFSQVRGTTNFNGRTTLGTLSVSGGTLTATSLLVSAGEATENGTIAAGSVTISGGTVSANELNITGGTTTISGGTVSANELNITGGTTTISGGTVSANELNITGGTTTISGGTTTTTNGTTVGNGGVLEIKYNSNTGNSGISALRGALTINDGGTVKLTVGDATGWNSTQANNRVDALTINEGGELVITTNSYNGVNQTFNMSGGITLQGGKISGTAENAYSKFDLYGSTPGITTLASSATAEISASVGLRDNGTFNVADGDAEVDLLVSGRLTSRAKFGATADTDTDNIWSTALTKSGAGTMKLTGDNQYWTSGGSVTEGTLIAASTTALGKGGTISVSENATLGFVAGTTVDMLKTTTTGEGGNAVTTTTNGAIQLERGAKIVVDMLGQDENQEKIVLDLVSGVALSCNEVTVTADNVDTLLGSAISLKNWGEGWTQSLSYADNTLSLTLTIPEPSTFGLLAGLGALALAGTRRRRKKA